jgi:ABC-type multidrug transport system fused ATPase/permease subunit
MYIFKLISIFAKKNIFILIIYSLFTLCAFPLEAIIIPQILSSFFDELKDGKNVNMNVFIKYFVLLLIMLIVVNFSNFATSLIESELIPKMNGYITNFIFSNLLKKYENSISEIELGKIITRLTVIPQNLRDIVSQFCIWLFPRALTVIIINIYYCYISVEIGITSIFLFIFYTVINLFYFTKCIPTSEERNIRFEEKNQDTQDKLSNSFSIYSNGNLKREIQNYEFKTTNYVQLYKKNLYCINKATIITSVLIISIFMIINSMATYLFIKKRISFANLMAIFLTTIYYIPCIITINSTMPGMINDYGILKSVDDFIEELYHIDIKDLNKENNKKKGLHKNIHNDENIITKKIKNGNIIINNLTFGYNEKNTLFKNFYLTVKDKEKVAIVGPSGNGKSTLIKLIMGYYQVPDNIIFIDNSDLNSFNLNELRRQISYVNQTSKLFNMTILENIQYGNNTPEKEIIRICDEINATPIFKNLLDGLHTNVGIEGSKLSGGQRQMIHILRCMFKKNKIVILDEPTSAIDKENKENILNAITELSKNSTLIIITHDDDLLRLVDRIIKIDAGVIVSDEYHDNKQS